MDLALQSNIALGQNFLIDKNIIKKIIDCIPIDSEVLEIGPGMGALSLEIAKITSKFRMIEKDKRMVEYLSKKINNIITTGDCLELSLDSEIIVTNLPYNISNRFLYKIMQETRYGTLLIMLQKELAEKIIKIEGAIGMLLNLHGTVRTLLKVNKRSFYPIPSVDSIFLEIKYKRNLRENFINKVRSIFIHPNRKIRNVFKEFEGVRPNTIKKEDFEKILN